MSTLQTNGLTPRDITTLFKILGKYPDIQEVILFGSRAKGTFRAGSDIDLAIANGPLPPYRLARLNDDFEESSLPYFVDVISLTPDTEPALREHIQRVGIPFYTRQGLAKMSDSQGMA